MAQSDEIVEQISEHIGNGKASLDDHPRQSTDLEASAGESKEHTKDFKTKQEFRGLTLLWLAYQSVGVIYGDIGTSPLYVYSSTFSSEPSYDDLLGALSLIIWTLTLMVTVKYISIVLFADDEGEGGTFALYSLLTRYSNIMKRNPREPLTIRMERYVTGDMNRSNDYLRSMMERNYLVQNLIKFLAVMGVCLVIADGILTPAQSILGAIQGLKVAAPHITTDQIVGISCGILVLLFLIQHLGTSKLGTTFAPIVIVWLLFNFVFGIYNLVVYDHSVLKAFSPYFAGAYFVRNRKDGWMSLGGILLSFTGVEALYADLGAFSAKAIRLSWLCFAYPCLLLAYIGQAAYISHEPSAVSNPFFKSVPPGMYWPSLVLSVMAAIVASQAMITGSFQLLSQTMSMSYFPKIKLVHTSTRFHGQVYIPSVNWLMMIGAVIVTSVFRDTTRLGNAYGVCVILVTFITTCMISIAAIIVWRLHPLLVLFGFIVFGLLDGLYMSSALMKVPHGAWFTIMLALALSSVLFLWRYGKGKQWSSEVGDSVPTSQLVFVGEGGELRMKDGSVEGKDVRRLKGVGVFFDKAGYMSPAVYTHFLWKFEAQHDVTVFFHLRQITGPTVPHTERYTVQRISSVPNTFRMIVRHGYNDHIFTSTFGSHLNSHLRAFLNAELSAAATPETRENVLGELAALDLAYSHKQVVYVFGKEQLRLKEGVGLVGRVLLGAYVWMRENTRSKVAQFNVPVECLVEVGYVKEV